MYKYIKRLLDILISLIGLIIAIPVMAIVLIITFFDIGRPLIDIRIPREGKDKKPFYMYKIRTRVYDKDGSSTYTKISKTIDKMGLNELPQLFNMVRTGGENPLAFSHINPFRTSQQSMRVVQ